MEANDLDRQYQILSANLAETRVRIRRYTIDPRLSDTHERADGKLAAKADEAWKKWLGVRDRLVALPEPPRKDDLDSIERAWLELDRDVDLIQRELVSNGSFKAGVHTVSWLAVALFILVVLYLVSHGIRGFDVSMFETWPESGPLKYGEVACWSAFGVLCYLLFMATYYLSRRDFDVNYQPWYVSTAIRGPFLTVVLMMVVLEFVEWYGEGKWIQTYLLEEGNKYYFIVFMSFCLGLSSHRTSTIIGDLSDGLTEFVSRAVGRVSDRLGSAVAKADSVVRKG